jgi:WD40 repeat protein
MKELVGHEATTNTAEWSPDGTMIVSTALDGTARLWDVATGDLVATFPEGHQVLSASFSPDGTRVVTSTNDGTVAIRRLPRWKSSSLELDRLLRCRVPFRVRDGQLVEVGRDRAECSASM